MCCKIGLTIFCILQFAVVVLLIVGTPIDQFRSKDLDIFSDTACVTLWGWKKKCFSTTYDIRPADLYVGCGNRLTRVRVAEACSIIAIGLMLISFILGLILMCCCACFKFLCAILNILGSIAALVTWSLMVQTYYNSSGNKLFYCGRMNNQYKYGAGFGLFVTGFALGIVAIIFVCLPC